MLRMPYMTADAQGSGEPEVCCPEGTEERLGPGWRASPLIHLVVGRAGAPPDVGLAAGLPHHALVPAGGMQPQGARRCTPRAAGWPSRMRSSRPAQ